MKRTRSSYKYTIHDFKKNEKNDDILGKFLQEDTISIINELAKLVGAPEYQRTPIFKKKNDRKKDSKQLTINDWESIRNFKATKLNKSIDGIEKNIDELRMLLNKLTKKNYDEIEKKITSLLENILQNDYNEDNLIKIGESIFEIGSMNKFWSKLYAKLYKGIIEIFPIMEQIYIKNVKTFLTLFDEIKYISAEEDYDAFCAINKENNKRRSLSSFLVHLMNNKVIDIENIGNIIISLVDKFEKLMDSVDNKEVVNEIGENICILIIESKNSLEQFTGYKTILTFLQNISDNSSSGLSNKIKFKCMDVLDTLNY